MNGMGFCVVLVWRAPEAEDEVSKLFFGYYACIFPYAANADYGCQ